MTIDQLVVAQIALAALQDLLFALVVGALACAALPGSPLADAPQQPDRCRFAAAISLAIACWLYLWLQTAVMSGTALSESWSAIPAVLSKSHFGLAWRLCFFGAALAALCSAWSGRTAWLGTMGGVLIYAAGKAAASHAADGGDFTFGEAVQLVHLCATALWAGGVIVAALVLFQRRHDVSLDAPARRAAFCTHLSNLASISLVVVIGTGIYNTSRNPSHLTAPWAPWADTQHGRVLTLKLVFVTLAFLLGGLNRMNYLPRLQAEANGRGSASSHARRGFDRLLTLEAAVMVVVLASAAMLGHTAP